MLEVKEELSLILEDVEVIPVVVVVAAEVLWLEPDVLVEILEVVEPLVPSVVVVEVGVVVVVVEEGLQLEEVVLVVAEVVDVDCDGDEVVLAKLVDVVLLAVLVELLVVSVVDDGMIVLVVVLGDV